MWVLHIHAANIHFANGTCEGSEFSPAEACEYSKGLVLGLG